MAEVRIDAQRLSDMLGRVNVEIGQILEGLKGGGVSPIDPLAHGSTNTSCTNTSCLTPGEGIEAVLEQ